MKEDDFDRGMRFLRTNPSVTRLASEQVFRKARAFTGFSLNMTNTIAAGSKQTREVRTTPEYEGLGLRCFTLFRTVTFILESDKNNILTKEIHTVHKRRHAMFIRVMFYISGSMVVESARR